MRITSRLAAATAIVLLMLYCDERGADTAVSVPPRQSEVRFPNLIARCRAESQQETLDAKLDCVKLHLRVDELMTTSIDGRVRGALTVENNCNTPVALLVAPVHTRVLVAPVAVGWEESVFSAYARFTLSKGDIRERPTLNDRGLAVRGLPPFATVSAHAIENIAVSGRIDKLKQLEPDRTYHATLCTFLARTNMHTAGAAAFVLDRSVEMFNATTDHACGVTLRPEAALVCAPQVAISAQTDTE